MTFIKEMQRGESFQQGNVQVERLTDGGWRMRTIGATTPDGHPADGWGYFSPRAKPEYLQRSFEAQIAFDSACHFAS